VERGAAALAELDEIRADLADTALHSPLGKPRTSDWPAAHLRVEALSVVRGNHATTPTSLEAAPGEIVALVGPTGCGKTSLLRALLGLEPGLTGAVRYGDGDLTAAGVGPDQRPFAWVPQEPAIVTGSIASNIALGTPGIDEPESRPAADALSLIGATSLLGRVGDPLSAGGPELSGGERQWVAIARALSTGLPVLLLDEPTAGLDPASQDRVLEALAAVRGRRTVILVTHRPEPLALADRIVRMP
jgi:ABC-type transport system involved in cytochrome bd biosynthesis fused ATPase/permease subunit